jgi:hypothetical protein
MVSFRRMGLFVVVTMVFGLALARGAEGPAPAGSGEAMSDEQIAKLIAQLDAERYAERQAASQKLEAAGKAAIPSLAKLAVGDSLEATVRAIDLLKKFYGASDEATKQAAKEALETVAKSDQKAAAKRAQDALRPVPSPYGTNAAGGLNFGVVVGGQAGLKKSMKIVNGVKEIDVEEQDGRKIKIIEADAGIKVEITSKKNGKEVTEKFEAKDAAELAKKSPEAAQLYKAHAAAVAAQGAAFQAQIQVVQGGNALPVVPRQRIDILKMIVKNYANSLGIQVAGMIQADELKKASKESKDELQKELDGLKKQITDLEKRLQEKDEQPTEKASDKSLPATPAPAVPAPEAPARPRLLGPPVPATVPAPVTPAPAVAPAAKPLPTSSGS